MPKFHVKRSHCLGGGVDVYEGQVVELDEKRAGYRVAMGWLIPVGESAAEPAPLEAQPSEPAPAESEPESGPGDAPEGEPEGEGEPGDAPPAHEFAGRQSGSRKSKPR